MRWETGLITVSCTRKTLSWGRLLISRDVGHSVGDADDGDEYEFSSSVEEKEIQGDEPQTLHVSTLSEEAELPAW